MKLGGFSLLRIGGIEVVIDYSWFVILLLMMYLMAENYFPRELPSHTVTQYWIMGVATAMLIFASVLVHELAHSLVALKRGVRVTSIRLLFFGGLSQVASEPRTGRDEFLIALAGPATNIVLGTAFFAIYFYLTFAGLKTPSTGIVEVLAFANILVGLFNLVPGLPLDGGRLLRAILWDHWNDVDRATKVVSRLGSAFALFLIIFGFLHLIVAQDFILGLSFLLMGFFMKQAALGSYQAVALRKALAGVQVKQIMTLNPVSVDWLVSIDELVREYVYRHQFANFPVFNRDEFVGMVSLEGVKTISKDLWSFKQVRDIMTPVEFVPCLNPDDDATDALSRMMSSDIGRMPVVENGKLLGIVSRHDIMNLFKIKSDLGLA
jgi:Zn-dependent protease